MLPFGFHEFDIDGWQYRVDYDDDPDDRTRKLWHCLVDPNGVHHYDEIDSIMGPYKKATKEICRDIIAHKEFQQCRAF